MPSILYHLNRFVFRYFGAAKDLPGVRELFEQEGKRISKTKLLNVVMMK